MAKILFGEGIGEDDTIINFNYDLLVDQELIANRSVQYENFSNVILGKQLYKSSSDGNGLYLKLHGSLNWFTCTSPGCRNNNAININQDQDRTLYMSATGSIQRCRVCQSEETLVLIPPLLHKPVLQMPIFKSIWANALIRLRNATNLVMIGYSFPPTDFYAAWLIKKAIEGDDDIKVWIVNPMNKKKNFRERMSNIFRFGFEHNHTSFDQIQGILTKI